MTSRIGFVLTAFVLAGWTTAALGQAPQPPKPATKPIPCNSAPESMMGAVAQATGTLEALWLKTKQGYFVGYRMPGMARNPFDRAPLPPDSGPRDGIAQARSPSCKIEIQSEARAIVRFVTPYYRFYETAAGWSAPLRDGLLMEVEVTRNAAGWTAKDIWSPNGILEPGERVRKPQVSELPRIGAWAAPEPPCAKGLRWNGHDCVKRRRRLGAGSSHGAPCSHSSASPHRATSTLRNYPADATQLAQRPFSSIVMELTSNARARAQACSSVTTSSWWNSVTSPQSPQIEKIALPS